MSLSKYPSKFGEKEGRERRGLDVLEVTFPRAPPCSSMDRDRENDILVIAWKSDGSYFGKGKLRKSTRAKGRLEKLEKM